MSALAMLQEGLLGRMVINFAFIHVWFFFFRFAHDWMCRLRAKWFRLSREQFDALHYAGIAFYKALIIVFNAMPWFVLWRRL